MNYVDPTEPPNMYVDPNFEDKVLPKARGGYVGGNVYRLGEVYSEQEAIAIVESLNHPHFPNRDYDDFRREFGVLLEKFGYFISPVWHYFTDSEIEYYSYVIRCKNDDMAVEFVGETPIYPTPDYYPID